MAIEIVNWTGPARAVGFVPYTWFHKDETALLNPLKEVLFFQDWGLDPLARENYVQEPPGPPLLYNSRDYDERWRWTCILHPERIGTRNWSPMDWQEIKVTRDLQAVPSNPPKADAKQACRIGDWGFMVSRNVDPERLGPVLLLHTLVDALEIAGFLGFPFIHVIRNAHCPTKFFVKSGREYRDLWVHSGARYAPSGSTCDATVMMMQHILKTYGEQSTIVITQKAIEEYFENVTLEELKTEVPVFYTPFTLITDWMFAAIEKTVPCKSNPLRTQKTGPKKLSRPRVREGFLPFREAL